jgi:putative SOS response-associated peptidase YedK
MAGYYEWQVMQDGSAKQPFYISDMNVGGLVAAGLYENWGSGEQREQSCTMITRPASSGLESIHHRMPVLLDPDSARQWLTSEVDQASKLLSDIESPDLVFWPVSRAVGNVRNDDKRLCEEIKL